MWPGFDFRTRRHRWVELVLVLAPSGFLRVLRFAGMAEPVRALASHQCGPGLIPVLGVIGGLSLLLVLVHSPSGFSPSTPVFPPLQPNPTLLKFQFDLETVSPISALR